MNILDIGNTMTTKYIPILFLLGSKYASTRVGGKSYLKKEINASLLIRVVGEIHLC